MINRRDFIRCSCGVAAGAIVAGLGISLDPSPARAEVAITGATVGLVIAGILAAYGIGTTNYNIGTELGIPEMLGNAFLTFSQDAQNYNQAVTAANSRISEIPGGVGFTDTELYDSIASASYLDGLSVALDPSAGLSLDWLNARGVEQAGLYGMIQAFISSLGASPTFDYENWKNLIPVGVPVAAASAWMALAGAPSEIVDTFTCPFEPALVVCWYQERLSDGVPKLASWHIIIYDKMVPYLPAYQSDAICGMAPKYDTGIEIWKKASAEIQAYYWHGTNTSSWTYSPANATAIGSVQNGWDATNGFLSISGVEPSSVNPGIGHMSDMTVDVGDVGFGGAIIGDGFTADNGMVTGFGSLPVFDPAYQEGVFPGVVDYPYPSALLDWRTGVFNPNDVLSSGVPITDIPGVSVPVPNGIALPSDLPVTVGIPVSGDVAVPSTRTLTLDDLIALNIDSSITGAISPSVPIEAAPFYPVNPPGTNSEPPSTLPDFPFPNIFPFNMLFEWLKWIRDNV